MLLKCIKKNPQTKKSKFHYFNHQKYHHICKDLISNNSLFEDSLFKLEFPINTITVAWKRPINTCDKPILIDKDDKSILIKPSQIAPIWFASLLLSLRQSNFLDHILVNFDDDYQFWRSGVPYTGIFQFQFFINGLWQFVVIDDRLPFEEETKLFSKTQNDLEYWEGLLEKALAKVLGSYENFMTVDLLDLVLILIGSISFKVPLDFSSRDFERFNTFDENITEAVKRHAIIICHNRNGKEKKRKKFGLFTDTYYTLTNLSMAPKIFNRISLSKLAMTLSHDSAKGTDMIQLQDPLRNNTYKGPYNKSSHEWKSMDNHTRKIHNLTLEYDNQFWLPFNDFVDFFDCIYILYGEKLTTLQKKVFLEEWPLPCPADNSLENIVSDCRQYLVEVTDENGINLKMSLNKVNDDITKAKCDHEEMQLGVEVVRTETNRRHRIKKSVYIEVLKSVLDTTTSTQTTLTAYLDRGNYAIIPWILNLTQPASYCLRILYSVETSITLAINLDCGKSFISRLFYDETKLITRIQILSLMTSERLPPIFVRLQCENDNFETKELRNVPYDWLETFIFYRKNPKKESLKVELLSTIPNVIVKCYGNYEFELFDWNQKDHGKAQVSLSYLAGETLITTSYRLRVHIQNFFNNEFCDL